MPKSTFIAKFQSLDEIRQFVAGLAQQAGFSGKEIYSIQLATDEACTNIIEYAYEGEGDNKIEVNCTWSGEEFNIVICDWGKSFDPSSVPEPNLTDDLSRRKIGGLGMYLMRRLMDQVDYRSIPDGGNILTMSKRKGVDS
ncbi:MAG: ATP-binding protein [Chloroflexota bacterium]